jgi:xanthine dioxygenase
MTQSLVITPLDNSLGARVTLPGGITDPSKLSDEHFRQLYEALHTHLVLIIPHQSKLLASSQFELTKRFDPSCVGNYGHSKDILSHKKNILKHDLNSVPSQPQVQILGYGKHYNHEGVKELNLAHPVHDTFHKDVLTDEEKAAGQTRFYRWHIDAALYALSPPVATTLLGIEVPPSDKIQKIVYKDTKEELNLAQASTCFVSGQTAFELLSEEDKKLALETTVVYPPHPFIYISDAKASSDGLVIESEGKELPFSELPPWEESKIKRLPMVWTNPVTGKQHLQIAGCAVYQLERNGETIQLEGARKEVHRLMRPAISPQHVYAHTWKPGDLVIFFNRGVWHSVTGHFEEGDTRLMHQCNISSGEDPIFERTPGIF